MQFVESKETFRVLGASRGNRVSNSSPALQRSEQIAVLKFFDQSSGLVLPQSIQTALALPEDTRPRARCRLFRIFLFEDSFDRIYEFEYLRAIACLS